jgi:16S rRNA (guanine527-N7)-methyltransferase
MTDLTSAIRAQADAAQYPLDEPECRRILQFLSLLDSWGRRIRLTGDHSPEQVVCRQLQDAFHLANELSREAPAESIDVGCGAGLPSIPLLILRPETRLTLLEPNHRRCAFMRTAIHELGLTATIDSKRLESHAKDSYQTAWSRATWSPKEWLERAVSLTIEGGRVLCFTVRPADLPLKTPEGLIFDGETTYHLDEGTPRLLARYRRIIP